MLQSERKMRQGLEMQHIQEKNELTALVSSIFRMVNHWHGLYG